MPARNIFLFLLIFSFTPGLSQKTKTGSHNVEVFSIGKEAVASDEFVYLYRKNHQHKQDEFTREKIEAYLDLFINFKLKVAEARQRGLDTTAAFKKEFNTYRDELRKPYLPDSRLVDSMVALTYERMKEEINASHILIAVNPDAPKDEEDRAFQRIMQIRGQALKDADFSALAKAVSEDPSAKVNAGNLGYFTAMQMVYPFESAAYQSRKGEVTNPIRTQFGYHILKINDRRPSSGEVEVSHILIRTGENKDNEKSKSLIFDLYDQLQKGVAWNELCKQYSEDPSSKDNGGKLRPFGVGAMPSVPQFERAAFELQNPGDYSDPFETQFGWHIIKLERKIPLAPFEELAPGLKTRVARDERMRISKQEVYEKLKSKYGYKVSVATRERVLATADSTIAQGTWKVPAGANSTNEMLFTLGGKQYFVNDFFNYVLKNQKRSSGSPQKIMEQYFESFVESVLLEQVEEKIAAETPEYKWLLNEYYEGIMLFDIMEKEIWNKASTDSLGQIDFFRKNIAAYKAGERVKATIYSATTREHIEKIASALAEKDSAAVESEVAALKIRTERGSFEKGDRVVLSKIPWSTGVYTAENNNLYYVVQVSQILPPGEKTFEEARADVISDYQNHLEKNWIAALKKKYPVRINKKGKEAVIKELLSGKSL